MLGKTNINFQEAQNFLIDMIGNMKYTIKEETDRVCIIEINIKSRTIIFKILYDKKVTVDISDSNYLLRIPKTAFKKIEDYKEFIVNTVSRI